MESITKLEVGQGEKDAQSHGVDTVDLVVDHLRNFIREQGLREGAVLPSEAELAKLFGSSRNTVREAIRTLKAYGLIESRRHVGAMIVDRRQEAMMNLFSFAVDVNAETFRDVQGFRRLIEINCAETLMRLEDQSYLDDAAAVLDYQVHRTMVDAVGNRTMSEVYGVLRPVICRLCELGKRSRDSTIRAYEQHQQIIDALRRKDSIEVAYRYSVHLDSGLVYLPSPPARAALKKQRKKK
jgi:GntR family transcriptional regulator, transcriptional repressor for pyruvate dehydrogenase complex